MKFGNSIQIRADRWFEYKRVGTPFNSNVGGMNILWQLKCLGIHDSSLDDDYEFLDCGMANGILLSAATESQAIETLRRHIMHQSEEYDNSHWTIELVGFDARQTDSEPIVHESHSYM